MGTTSVSAVAVSNGTSSSNSDLVLSLLKNTMQVAEIRAEHDHTCLQTSPRRQLRNVNPSSHYSRYRLCDSTPHPNSHSRSRPHRPNWYDGKC